MIPPSDYSSLFLRAMQSKYGGACCSTESEEEKVRVTLFQNLRPRSRHHSWRRAPTARLGLPRRSGQSLSQAIRLFSTSAKQAREPWRRAEGHNRGKLIGAAS